MPRPYTYVRAEIESACEITIIVGFVPYKTSYL